MFSLQWLRQARNTTQWVVFVFMLALGVATVSPLVQAQSMTVICTVAGQVQIVVDSDSGTPTPAHKLNCLACLPAAFLPPVELPVLDQRPDLSYAFNDEAFASPYWLQLAPSPARGPPSV